MNLTQYVCAVSLSALMATSVSEAASRSPQVAIQILSDDSGVLSQPERAHQYKLLVLAHLKNLKRQRKFAQARIDVISTSYGRTVWVGDVLDLNGTERAGQLVKKIEANATYCQNFAAAFSELNSNVQQLTHQGVNEIHIIVFSSLVDTPRPCKKQVEIRLPQLPPAGIDVNGILTSSDAIRSVAFYWVDPAQESVWLDFMKPTADAMAGMAKPFGIFDIEASAYQLRHGLLGVSR